MDTMEEIRRGAVDEERDAAKPECSRCGRRTDYAICCRACDGVICEGCHEAGEKLWDMELCSAECAAWAGVAGYEEGGAQEAPAVEMAAAVCGVRPRRTYQEEMAALDRDIRRIRGLRLEIEEILRDMDRDLAALREQEEADFIAEAIREVA